jgi:D-serine deaminase-like pyridoxal phosphate-dependent protein
MPSLADMPTPLVVIDQPVMHRNIHRMQQRASEAGKRLRPHGKTHKSPEIAGLQTAAGAVGLTCAKPGEAEVFVEGGVDDIRIAYPVSPVHADRLVALMDRARVSIIVDSLEVAEAWSAAMTRRGTTLPVLTKIDVGLHRCGFDPERQDIRQIVRAVAALPGLRLQGLLSHAGHAYLATSRDEIGAITAAEAALLARIRAEAAEDGIALEEVSVGSTPSAEASMSQGEVTEVRPGNYVFCDRTQVALGSATWADCALTIVASVVSSGADRLVFDCGSKVLSTDGARGFFPTPGFGAVLREDGTPDDTLLVERLSEEHAVVRVTGETSLRIGSRVRIVPNHACVVANLTNQYLLADGDAVAGPLPVAARGRVV